MDYSNIILAYFVIGVVMFGGGAINYQNAGVATFFVDQQASGGFGPAQESQQDIESIGGAITDLIGQAFGAIALVYNLILGLLIYLHWPVFVLSSNNAPPMATVLLGGSFTVAFYMSVVRLVTASA